MGNETFDFRKGLSDNTDVIAELQLILTELEAINANTDGLEAQITSIIAELTTLNGTDFATETTLLALKTVTDDIKVLLTSLDGKDFATETTLLTRLSKSDFETRINTQGQKTMAASTPVVLPSDQTVNVSVSGDIATTPTTTSVTASVTSVLLKASNTDRRQITITNGSVKRLSICFFTPATVVTPFFLDKDESWVFDKFTGAIYGIWTTGATGSAYVTEETA